MSLELLSLLFIFELVQLTIHILFKHFENLQNLILNILKEKFHIP